MFKFKKENNKDFTVLNLTDIQIYINDITGNSENLCFFKKTTEELVELSSPDLITVSGDISNGDGAGYLEVYRAFADYIDGFGLPWTVVFGNHDNQGGVENISDIVNMYKEYSGFVYESGDSSLGNGNFVIGIEENFTPVSALIMMDSHDRTPYMDKTDTWGRLNDAQISWYCEQMRFLNHEGYKSSAIIVHIPIYAYREAYAAAATEELRALNEGRKITFKESCEERYWNEGYKDSYGLNYETVSSYPCDDGVMDAIAEYGNTKLVLCGHDHVNSSCIKYRGVTLMYALKTGKGCYFHPSMNGGTVLKINSEGKIEARHIFVFEEQGD